MTPRDLDELQRWFQNAIMQPGGGAGDVDSIISRSSLQTADERLAVYAHSYWARLLECLQEDFPAVRAAIGNDAFDGLAIGYLAEHPSTSYTLAQLADRFADYLAATAPDDDFSKAVVELTRLERAITDVFDLPGGETLGFLTVDELAAVPVERRGDVRLRPLPTFRLLRFHFDVNQWFTALRKDAETAPPPDERETFVALSRRGYVVRRHPLTTVQYELLTALDAGRTLAEALAAFDENESPATLESWFAQWAAAGLFARIML